MKFGFKDQNERFLGSCDFPGCDRLICADIDDVGDVAITLRSTVRADCCNGVGCDFSVEPVEDNEGLEQLRAEFLRIIGE